jgi:hypothetical protein
MSDERTRRVAPVEKRTPNEHCARECDSFLPIVSSCRRDEVYPEWMVLARHVMSFLTARCQFIDRAARWMRFGG